MSPSKDPRVCVGAGAGFAVQKAKLTIAGLLCTFIVDAVPGKAPEPVSRLTIRAKDGVALKLTPIAETHA